MNRIDEILPKKNLNLNYTFLKRRHQIKDSEDYVLGLLKKNKLRAFLIKDMVIKPLSKQKLQKIYKISSLFNREKKRLEKRFIKGINNCFNGGGYKKFYYLLSKIGCPDILIVHMGKLIFIEVKSHKDNIRPDQIKWINEAQEEGYQTIIVFIDRGKRRKKKNLKIYPSALKEILKI